MSMHRSVAAGLWLLAVAGAYAVVAAWADDARSGKIPPWTLVVLFWGVALVSVTIHHLSHYLSDHLAQAPDALGRWWTLWRRWKAEVGLGARRLGSLYQRGQQAMARSTVAADAPRLSDVGRSPLLGTALSLALPRGVAAVSAAVHGLAQAPDTLRRTWTQCKLVLGPHLSHLFGQALDALKHWRLQLRRAVGQVRPLPAAVEHSAALAARLGALIGVR